METVQKLISVIWSSPIHTRFRAKSFKVAPLHLTLLPEIWHKLGMPANEKQFLDNLEELKERK